MAVIIFSPPFLLQNFTLTDSLPDPLASTTVQVRADVANSLRLLWVYIPARAEKNVHTLYKRCYLCIT